MSVTVYTDGSAQPSNPGWAGSGVVVQYPTGQTFDFYRALGWQTNNVAELTAISFALDVLEPAVPKEYVVIIHTDSQYSIGVITGTMKAKKNVELIASIQAKVKRWPNVNFQWVKGHNGNPLNEKADVLANQGSVESQRVGKK
jgi:ribonuclease HI